MRFGSLFAGIGGLDLGLERAGMECAWQVEIDDYATRVLEKHWPNVRRWRDVRTWPQPDTERVDLVCGGFPCQDISLAGRGARLSGERSGLWREMLRIIRDVRPRYIVIENVAALLVRGLDSVLFDVAESGYDAEWSTISACSLGAPHTRDRLFVIAYRHEKRWRRVGFGNERQHGMDTRFNAWKTSPRGKWRDVERWAGEVVENGGGIAPAAERGGMVDGVPDRLDRIGACGNAVVPQIGQLIGESIMSHWEESDCPSETDFPRRCCGRCNDPIEDKFWDYEWCESCSEHGTCRHGFAPHKCNKCMIESDVAFDGARESTSAAHRKDEAPDDA